jgi:hypothetical protein
MMILVACEESQVVCKAFRAKGHEAYSCDILPTSGDHPEWHIQVDVLDIIYKERDLIISHPPCTYLCNSGVRWLNGNVQRWIDMRYAADFFNQFLNHPHCKRIAIENPIMHKYAVAIIGRKQDQVIQPWQFGHKEIKATCLWLKGLPPLVPTNIVGPPPKDRDKNEWDKVHRASPGPDRAKLRSKTLQGYATAMADQWNF